MSDQNAILYAAPEPYPPIRVERPNPRYAQMLQANFASAGSELTSITQYTYHSLVLGRSAPEAVDALHHISITEMHHLDIFGRLVLLLGGDPRYCSPRQGCPVAWNGNMVTYHASLCEAVQSDISLEQAAIHTYQYQAAAIEDCYISAMLNRIILDEQLHIRAFRRILESCC